jgi:hypothetical protein
MSPYDMYEPLSNLKYSCEVQLIIKKSFLATQAEFDESSGPRFNHGEFYVYSLNSIFDGNRSQFEPFLLYLRHERSLG